MLLMLSARNLNMLQVATVTWPNQTDFAVKWGIPRASRNLPQSHIRPASWHKLEMIRDYWTSAQWIMWMDADAMVTNMSIDPHQFLDEHSDLVIGTDKNGINCGVFFLQTTVLSCKLVENAWARTDLVKHPWWEQKAFMEEIPKISGYRVKTHPCRAFNSMLSSGTPPQYRWQKGDFVAHAAGMSMDARFVTLNKLSKEVI